MAFYKEKIKNYYLKDTPLENMFISEYMPGAPSDYVKVYLYAYMHSGLNLIMENDDIARDLNMNIEDVLKAWTYWESLKVVRKYYPNPKDKMHYDIEFVSLKNALFCASNEDTENKLPSGFSQLNDESISNMFKEVEHIIGGFMRHEDRVQIVSWMEDDGTTPEIITFAFRYCREARKRVTTSYVGKIIISWKEKGILTVDDAKSYLEKNDIRYGQYKKIMKALGLSYSTPTEEEKKTFDMWMDNFKMSLNDILEVTKKAAGRSNKYLYVKKIIENDYGKKSSDKKSSGQKRNMDDRQSYYTKLREQNEKIMNKNQNEVYSKIPQVEKLDQEIRRLGFESGRALISGADNKKNVIKQIRAKIDALTKERITALENHNYPGDYMDMKYSCSKCKDTGILDNGANCSCYDKHLDGM